MFWISNNLMFFVFLIIRAGNITGSVKLHLITDHSLPEFQPGSQKSCLQSSACAAQHQTVECQCPGPGPAPHCSSSPAVYRITGCPEPHSAHAPDYTD